MSTESSAEVLEMLLSGEAKRNEFSSFSERQSSIHEGHKRPFKASSAEFDVEKLLYSTLSLLRYKDLQEDQCTHIHADIYCMT